MNSHLSKICEKVVNIFFPTRCIICEKYGFLLCQECLQQIEKTQTSVCPECGRISVNCRFCPNCRNKKNQHISSVYVATSYQSSVVKELIKNYKYHGLIGLSEICGELIYQRIKESKLPANIVIVPVPLHRLKYNKRGFNQSELMARYLSKRMQIAGADAIERIKNTETQVKLQRNKRLINVLGAFRCKDVEAIVGKSVLLIDDVFTTGSTLNECAKILKEAGAKKVYGAVVTRNI